MDPPLPNQGPEVPGQQQQPPAAAEEAAAQPLVAVPAAEVQQPASSAEDSEAGSQGSEGDWDDEEGGGPDSLLQLAQKQVLGGIEAAARGIQPPFSVGGSLGRLPIALAVAQPPPTATTAEASAAAASQPAVAVRFPEGGEAALQALEALCQPASFGKGTGAVLDEGYRRALALPSDRLFPQFDLAQNGGLLESVRRLLLPDAALLTTKLHTLNVYKPGGFFRPHRDTPRGGPRFVGSLVVCLPVGHAGGALRVEQSGRSVTYDWGPGAAAGEVQWAAFYSDCLHEVLPVTDGARVTLAWELFAYPAEAANQLPAQIAALPNGADSLLHALRTALDSNSFLVNGGRLGFPLQHAYPSSLAEGITPQDVPAMLKGADAALVHVLQALGLRFELLRVWQDDSEETCGGWEPPMAEADPSRKALLVSTVQPASLRVPSEEEGACQDCESSWLQAEMDADWDCSIIWLARQEEFPEWTVGAAHRFYYGNYPTSVHAFYCTLGLLALIPPFTERPDRAAAQLAWAGAAGTAGGSGEGSAEPASPASKKAKTG